MEDFIKRKMDLEAASALLSKAIENLTESIQRCENKNDNLSKRMYEGYATQYAILTTCKGNIEFVIKVLADYISQQTGSSSLPISYSPRKLTFLSDIGKYQTETLKAKRAIEHLSWIASMSNDEELHSLCIECVEKLNYVYAHIAKTYNNYKLSL